MSTSRSSASESESFAENDVSFEESADDSSQSTEPISHQQQKQQQHQPQQQQQQHHHVRQKHYIVETPNARYIVNGNLNGNNISLMPSYHQGKGNSLLPPPPHSTSQYGGSQYFMDNNVIHRTYSYYNNQSPMSPQQQQQQVATMQKYQKNPDFVSVRYIAQPADGSGGAETLMYRTHNGPYMPYPPPYNPSGTIGNFAGNSKERRIIFGREAYGTEPSNYFPYPSAYYTNQAFEPNVGSQRILNYDVNSVIQQPSLPPNYDSKRMMKMQPHEQMKQIENHEAVSSQWNMSGGFGNSYGINQKFYKELIDSNNNNPPSFNPFYSDNNNTNNNNNNGNNKNQKNNKNNYFGLGNNSNKRSKKNFKIIIGSSILAFIVLCIIVFSVLGIILPKYYYSQPASSVVKSLIMSSNMTLNETEIIKMSTEESPLARLNDVVSSFNNSILNETSFKTLAENNKTTLEIINSTEVTTTATTTLATTSLMQTINNIKNETNITIALNESLLFEKIKSSFVPETEKIVAAFTLKMIPAQILTTSKDLIFELPTTLKSKERLIQVESTSTTTTTAINSTSTTTSPSKLETETIKSILINDKILIDNLNTTISNATAITNSTTTPTTTITTTTVGSSLNFDTDAQYIF